MSFQKIASFLFLIGIAVAVWMKLWTVPITHDEAWSIMRYVPEDIWSIITYPDTWPNNHILNTLLTKLSTGIFGFSDWAARLPNFMALFLYAWAAHKIVRLSIGDKFWSGVFLFVLFFVNPYMLDFFSLCRGYGLSIAFLLGSVYFMVEAFKKQDVSSVFMAVGYAMLSSYANFTALVFWASTMLVAALFIYLYSPVWKRHFLYLTGGGLVYLGLIISPILKMRGANQFKFWSSSGFFSDTVVSSIDAWKYGAKLFVGISSTWIAVMVVVGFLAMLIFAIFKLYKSYNNGIRITSIQDSILSPFYVVFSLLLMTFVVNIVQCYVLQTPYLSGRTALLYFPLYMGAMGLFVIHIGGYLIKWTWLRRTLAGCIVLLCIVHMVDRYKQHTVREWWYDASNKEVVAYLSQKGESTLATSWIFHPSLQYYKWSGQADHLTVLPYNKKIDPSLGADYYYIELKEKKLLGEGYVEEKKFTSNRVLMKKETKSD